MGGTTVIDNLTSSSSSSALSANQGRVLNEKIGALELRVEDLEENPSGGSVSNSITRVWSE